MSSASKLRYQADNQAAKKSVYATSGRGPNPYEPDTRLHRMWIKWHQHYWSMEALM